MARILTIAPYRFLKPTNGGHWAIHLGETIYASYNEVHVVSVISNDGSFETDYVKHFVLSNSVTRYIPFKITKQLEQLVVSVKPTHLTCHHPYLFPALSRVAKKYKLPVFVRSHNIESDRFKTVGKWWWKLMFYFEKYVYCKADKVFFISNEDRDWAITHYRMNANNAVVLPFATPFAHIPSSQKSRSEVAALHHIDANKKWLVFMGLLDYLPNEEAVKLIVNEIYPRLKQLDHNFEILICGKGLKQEIEVQISTLSHIHYLGFVEDLDAVLYHAHIMLNPVLTGGGVKTKVLEALAWNTFVISTHFGALGVEAQYCGDKLILVPNNDWELFAHKVVELIYKEKTNIPNAFFEHYSIAAVAKSIQKHFE